MTNLKVETKFCEEWNGVKCITSMKGYEVENAKCFYVIIQNHFP